MINESIGCISISETGNFFRITVPNDDNWSVCFLDKERFNAFCKFMVEHDMFDDTMICDCQSDDGSMVFTNHSTAVVYEFAFFDGNTQFAEIWVDEYGRSNLGKLIRKINTQL